MPSQFEILYEPDIWIADTGATNHATRFNNGAINIREGGIGSVGQTGNAVDIEQTFDLPGQWVDRYGTLGLLALMKEVSYSRRMNFNLFSLGRMLANGWFITNGDSSGISIANASGDVINFDIVIKTRRGALFAARFLCQPEVHGANTDQGVSMNINKAHALLGHGDKESTRQSARELGWRITRGKMKPCVHCAKAKARQKNRLLSREEECSWT